MDKHIKEEIHTIQSNQQLMIEQLHTLCNINSGSENLEGLARMADTLSSLFSPLADETSVKTLAPFQTFNMAGEASLQAVGDALLFRKRPEAKRRILLSGHMDTVYSIHHPFQQMTYLNDEEINGPGVSDMKGGLLVILHTLQAFERLPCAEHLGWDVLINADEEIGSPGSSVLFDELAANYQAGLVYEPAASKSGTIAKNRKGSGKFTIIAKGKAAHAGRAFYEGRNAICYLAEVITEIHALNGLREGVTINVGLMAGGDALNIVPAKAVAKLDVRISHPEDADWVRQQLNAIMDTFSRKDYELELAGVFSRPVKKVSRSTERLFERIKTQGLNLGLNIDWKDTGGCCDGNNIAQHGIPVIDTLGVRGGNIHSSDEFIILDSLAERVSLSFLLLNDLATGGLEDLSK